MKYVNLVKYLSFLWNTLFLKVNMQQNKDEIPFLCISMQKERIFIMNLKNISKKIMLEIKEVLSDKFSRSWILLNFLSFGIISGVVFVLSLVATFVAGVSFLFGDKKSIYDIYPGSPMNLIYTPLVFLFLWLLGMVPYLIVFYIWSIWSTIK